MPNVIMFPTAHVAAGTNLSASEIIGNVNLPGDRHNFLMEIKKLLCSDDYLDVLEGIASFEIYMSLDDDLQSIVSHFLSLE